MTEKRLKLIIFADGALTPTQSGAGIILYDDRGRILGLYNRQLPHMTCNEAEYHGLLLALEKAIEHPDLQIEIRLDSEIVVNQMNGRFAVNSAKLKPLHRQACELSRRVPHLTLTHISRELNRMADALAAEAAAGRTWRSEEDT